MAPFFYDPVVSSGQRMVFAGACGRVVDAVSLTFSCKWSSVEIVSEVHVALIKVMFRVDWLVFACI